ncbi:MAG: type III-A CRISPR-associated RAMP protein Csm3 [Candidatus Omnitrophica bacterium]|nr:type III-A CRISPR-associated RAMP protein Csm3 [Candidatus Omnitrophota bacterium]
MEKKEGKVDLGKGKVHMCYDDNSYSKCPICKIWGISPTEKDMNISGPIYTRLIVRDAKLLPESIAGLKNLQLQWTEIKTENVINRIKGSAESPRQIERVPAGAVFSFEMLYSVFDEIDIALFKKVFEAMELVEHDYLGGMGSRGYGKVKFEKIVVYWNKKEDYESGNLNKTIVNNEFDTPELIVKNFEKILGNLK